MDLSPSDYDYEHYPNQRSKAMEATTHEDIDMTVVQRVFEKAGNAIVDASRLAKAVQELEERVNRLVNDVDYLRDRNKHLDEQMGYLRKERDELRDKLNASENENKQLRFEKEEQARTIDQQASDLQAMTERWHAASKERDDAMLREMELQDRLKEAEGKLGAIQKALGIPQAAPVTKEVFSQIEEELKQVDPPQFGGHPEPQAETTEERERREAQSRDEAGRFGPKVVGGDWGSF